MPADLKSHIFAALINAWALILKLAPYVAFGILAAAVLSTFSLSHNVAGLIQKRKWWHYPLAAVIGMTSPACTFGTVPIIIEMVRRGADVGCAATFLVASSIINPQMFMLVLGALGTWFALAQVTCVLVLAILVGTLFSFISHSGKVVLAENVALHDSDYRYVMNSYHAESGYEWWRRFGRSLVDLAEFVGFYFVLGCIIAALVEEFVPSSLLVEALGEGRWWAVPMSAVASVPLYVCGGAMIPFLAVVHKMGMASGAVLAVLIAGPATRITALSALTVVFRKRFVVAYVFIVLIFAMLVGLLFRIPIVSRCTLAS